MENHPIPQDITGFQFKLVGNMTVKQFVYLASGAILGWLFFISPLPIVVKLPLAILFIAGGAIVAFIPVEGRPMDVMIGNFIKALLSPTKYVYSKEPPPSPPHSLPIEPKREDKAEKNAFQKVAVQKMTTTELKDTIFFDNTQLTFHPKPDAPIPQEEKPYAFSDISGQSPDQADSSLTELRAEQQQAKNLEIKEEMLEHELSEAKAAEAGIPGQPGSAHQRVANLEQQLKSIMEQKRILEQQLAELSKRLEEQKPVFVPSTAPPTAQQQTPLQETKNVRKIPAGGEKAAGLPATPEAPNIVTGIIKDPRGNPLPNILVEVKDAEGNPVRAFKTNGLGHFASATPLVNGSYTIEFDDPKKENKFDIVSFSAQGDIILPLEVISVDTREELRRELFN